MVHPSSSNLSSVHRLNSAIARLCEAVVLQRLFTLFRGDFGSAALSPLDFVLSAVASPSEDLSRTMSGIASTG